MAPKRKASQLSVQFTNAATATNDKVSSPTLPFFLTATGISGIIDTATLGTAFDGLHIKLDGNISVQIPQRHRLNQCSTDNAAPYRRLTKRTIALAQSLDIGSATGTTSFPFHLDIRNGNPGHDRSGASSSAIPPTYCHRKIASSATSTQAETTEAKSSYTFSIYAVLNNAAVASIAIPVRIYDNLQVQPPAYQAPAGLDYASHQSTTFRRNFIAKTGSFAATVLAEPAPLVFAVDIGFATTSVPLQMTAESKIALSKLDASITWRLRTSSFASISPMSTCPTMQQARNAPSSIISTSSLGLKHEAKMQLTNQAQVSGAYASRQDLAIALPKSAFLIPTTHTEHISRRYSVQVEICVHGEGVGKASVSVETPLQIGYQDPSGAQAPRYQEQEGTADLFKFEMHACRPADGSISLPPVYSR